MPTTQLGHLDEKGRLIIPSAFREVLNMKENSNVLITLSAEKNAVLILPFAAAGDRLCNMVMELSDTPGALSRIMALLAKESVDFVQMDAVASERGKTAMLHAVVDFSKCKTSPEKVKAEIMKEKLALSVEIVQS